MATLGMFGGSAPRRMIRLRPEDQDPMLAQMQIAPMAAPQMPRPRFTAASMMGGNDPAPPPVSEQPAAAGAGATPPLGMFGSSAPKPSKMEATGKYRPGERDWWGEISSDPFGFLLTGTSGLSEKRAEAMNYEAAQAAAEQRARQEAARMEQARAAGLDPGGILAMGLNPEEFGKSYGENYAPANVGAGDSRVYGNGRETFTAPKFGVDGGFGYTQTPEGIEWGDQRGQNYTETTAEGTLAETGRHNRADEGLGRDRLDFDKTRPPSGGIVIGVDENGQPIVRIGGPSLPIGGTGTKGNEPSIGVGPDGQPVVTPGEQQLRLNKSWNAIQDYEAQNKTVTADVRRALDQTSGWTTGLLGASLKKIPGTPQHDLWNTLNTVKSNIGFDKLQSMRDNSPTGGALGQVSEFENRLLQSVWGALEQSQSEDQFRYNLNRLLDVLEDKEGRRKAAFAQDYPSLAQFTGFVSDASGQVTPDDDIDSLVDRWTR